ncbi:MAG: FAD-binding oxidoreductase [Acidimicrobiia bacterium]|nr:FAD-binding oxidoreductase [Acidimicrobiia bacterium]
MLTQPFWTDDFPKPAGLGGRTPPAAADVVVIGAGYTGLSAARQIVESGASVVVVDAGPVGAGASTINGGMTTKGLKATNRDMFKMYGAEKGRAFWEASVAAIDLVETIIKEEGIDCSFGRYQAAGLAMSGRAARNLQSAAEWDRTNLGFDSEFIEGSDVRNRVVDSASFVAARVDPIAGGLHPARYLYGLAGAVERSGATLVEHAPVTAITRSGDGYRVTTGSGVIRAGQVVVATNGYTGPLLPRLRRGVIPIGSYIVVTEPLDAGLAERLIPGGRMLWTAKRFLNYFRLTPDNRLLMGGRNNLSTDLDLHASADIQRATIGQFFPELADVRLTHTWSGKLGVTFDLMPHIGRIDGVWYGLGYGGHGVAVGTYIGAEVGKLVTGAIESSPFLEIDHPTRWYYRNRTWFLPYGAWMFRFLDAIGR